MERDVEPALRFPVLYEIILLRQLLGDQRTVAALLPLLKEAAETAGNPREARAAVERIAQRPGDGWAATGGTDFEGLLYDAQAFVRNGDLEAAEKALIELRGRASSPRFAAYWSIAAGELEWARAQGATGVQGAARQALGHFARASRLAGDSSEPHIRAEALRLAGRVQALIFADAKGAADRWIEAARLDEQVAHLQETDEIRIRYLESHPTELDEVIGTTAARVPVEGGQAAAQVLAALELARGVTFLSLVQPASAVRPRSVPASEDLQGCWAWCRDLGADLPRDMAMWILHPTPDRLYQAVLGNGILHWVATPVDRYELSNTLSELRTSWSGKDVLESLVQNHPDILPDRLGKLARWLRLDLSLGTLPAKVRRLAIVAGGSLADIPFAALPLPGSASPPQLLVSRYALSYLPCLSAQHPLGQRSARNRGDAGLLVRPPAADLTGSTGNGFHLLDQKAATPSGLGRVLQSGACPMVRIDCHGSYDAGDAQESWLALSTEDGDDGHLTARRLQSLPLRSCGTLILGACESGMSQERGRDERIGFARAGLAAGASAVLAARWVAEDQVASALLDAFQRRLRFLPRDEALRLSQLDLLQGRWRPSAGPSVPNPAHPARWACWSLWGDPGLQTSAGWIVRAFRRLFAGQEKS
ncbi:MAG TPA: CHAT domain-containing protein [Thermoanaerobaculia bacterium]|nr:CHAT domain-containing protein [Thermoanaerobaculia bacterium]